MNYRSVKTGKLTSDFDEEESILYITNNETNITKAIHFLHIPVDDQKALNLKNQELIAVLDFHKKYKQGVVLAHCDSGVGRTGQTALLLAIQSYLSNNTKTNQKVLQLIDALINNSMADEIETEKLIRQLYKAMGRILNQLRKIRFSVEQPEQFLNSFVQTLLLSATEKKEYSHSQIDRLRSTLSDFKPTCFTEAHKASPRSSDNPLRALEEDRNETTPVSLYQSSSGDDSVRSVTPSQLELAEHDASALYAELSSPTTTSPKSPTFFTRLKSESYLDKADTVSSDEIYNSSSDIEGEKTERTTEKEAMRHEELDLVFDSPEEDFPSPELPLSPKLTKQPLFKPTPPPTASQQKPGAQIRTTLGFARQ